MTERSYSHMGHLLHRLGWIMAVVAVMLVIGGYVFFTGERKAPVRYRTVPLERGTIVSTVSATGTINPVTTVQVGSQVSGMIEGLYADFNSIVKSGQVVARIDPFPYRARRDQAKATLANTQAAVVKARVELAQRKRELDRAQSLLKEQFISQNEVDVALTGYEGAQAQLAVAQAAVQQAAAALEAAELDLKYTVIRSPVDGIVIARQVEVGQRVSATFQIPTLFLIAEDLTNMQVDANVSEADIGGIEEGKEASFTVDAYPGEVFHGHVRQVRNAPISVQNVVTYDVVIGVRNPDFRLKPGMTANVSIVVERKDDILRVPNAALRFTPPKGALLEGAPAEEPRGAGIRAPMAGAPPGSAKPTRTLWRLTESGEPEMLRVATGITDGSHTEVVSAELEAGALIVVGVDSPSSGRRSESLPPGFGGSQRRPSSRTSGS